MRKAYFILLLAAASSVGASELDETQTAAVGVLTPMLAEQVTEEQAQHLAECMVTTAKAREVRQIAKADPANPGEKVIRLSNKVIARPDVLKCMTERLVQ